jgi:hypothetical protein
MTASCCPPFCFLDLHFDPEDGGDMFLRNISGLSRTTRRYIPEYRTLHDHRCENLKSYTNLHSILYNLENRIHKEFRFGLKEN